MRRSGPSVRGHQHEESPRPAGAAQPVSSQGHSLQRPERRITILFLATAVTLGFVGTTIGALTLARLSGAPTDLGADLFSSHPFVQIFGFVAEFVMGVGYSLIPRFKAGRFARVSLAYVVYLAMTLANVASVVSLIYNRGPPMLPDASLLMLGGSIVFAYQVVSIVRGPTGGFPEVNNLLILSPLALVLTTALFFLELQGVVKIQDGFFSPQLIYLVLVGFAGSEIYAVQIRSVSFRQCDYRKRSASAASALQATGISAAFLDSLVPSAILSILAGVFFLGAALSILLSLRVLELAHPLMLRPAMTRMHYTIMRYNEACILSAAVWLLIGCILGIAWLGFGIGTFFVRDTFIHSVAIGFIGADITCFAPMLLPGLLGRKGPVTGLSFWPITLLDSGVFIRVLGNAQTLGGSGLPLWEASSGPIIIAAMAWFLLMLKNVGVKHQGASGQPVDGGTEGVSWGSIQKQIDMNLAIADGSSTQKPVSIWFVEKDGFLYALPPQGPDTPWYRSVTEGQRVWVSFKGMKLSGTASPVTEVKQVKRIIKLFKDKYGQRNYENYVGGRANVGIKIEVVRG